MVTTENLADAIAGQLDTVLNMATSMAIHVEPIPFATAETPYIDIFHSSTHNLIPDAAMFGDLLGPVPFIIRAVVSPADVEAGSRLLYQLVDDSHALSIVAALDSDPSFGGVATGVWWGDWSGFTDFPDPNGGGMLLGETLPIEVIKARS